MIDKEDLLKEIVEDVTKLYDDYYEEELCHCYENLCLALILKSSKVVVKIMRNVNCT